MDINHINQKIVTARGKLQPTILKAILNLYLRSHQKMTARDVKEECLRLDNTIQWDDRLPAICNAMRKATECGGLIVGEDRDKNQFTIEF